MKTAVLNVEGANCPACIYTIEKLGRKVEGVAEVRVLPARGEVRVDYTGDTGCLESIVGIIAKLGYTARIRTGPAA